MNKSNTILGLTIILLLAFLFQYRYMNEFPTYIHAWAQSDRYALALGFTNNHLNFFKPQTFIMNPQFPGDFLIPKNESITAVNFPIHDYIPAVIMKLSSIRSPWIFRLYILL